jgi:protein phosphatase
MFVYRSVGDTNVGRVRKHNEDAYFRDDELGLYIVADGLGGHAAGEVASEETVHTIKAWIKRERPKLLGLSDNPYDEELHNQGQRILESAIQAATYMVHAMAEYDETKAGMGTTASVLLVVGCVAFLGQVGDSRIYLTRDGQIAQVTDDHTLIAAQIREGMITAEEARYAPHRNVITRAVGSHDYVEVDTRVVEVVPGDRFLLCTDGLHGYLETDEETLQHMVMEPGRAIKALTELALVRGGKDNITSVLVEIAEA